MHLSFKLALTSAHYQFTEVRHLLNRIHTARRKIKQISSASLLTKLDRLEKDLGEAIVLAKTKYEMHLHGLQFSQQPFQVISTPD